MHTTSNLVLDFGTYTSRKAGSDQQLLENVKLATYNCTFHHVNRVFTAAYARVGKLRQAPDVVNRVKAY